MNPENENRNISCRLKLSKAKDRHRSVDLCHLSLIDMTERKNFRSKWTRTTNDQHRIDDFASPWVMCIHVKGKPHGWYHHWGCKKTSFITAACDCARPVIIDYIKIVHYLNQWFYPPGISIIQLLIHFRITWYSLFELWDRSIHILLLSYADFSVNIIISIITWWNYILKFLTI